jgi:hypothetical protein
MLNRISDVKVLETSACSAQYVISKQNYGHEFVFFWFYPELDCEVGKTVGEMCPIVQVLDWDEQTFTKVSSMSTIINCASSLIILPFLRYIEYNLFSHKMWGQLYIL